MCGESGSFSRRTMAKKPKLSREEQERQDLLERYKQKLLREVEDEFIERMRAKEEAEQKRESA